MLSIVVSVGFGEEAYFTEESDDLLITVILFGETAIPFTVTVSLAELSQSQSLLRATSMCNANFFISDLDTSSLIQLTRQ